MTYPTGFGIYKDRCEDCDRWPCVCDGTVYVYECADCEAKSYDRDGLANHSCAEQRKRNAQAKALGTVAKGVLR